MKPARKDAFALNEAAIRRAASCAASLAPSTADVATDRVFAIGCTSAFRRAVFVRPAVTTEKFIAAAVVVGPAAFHRERRAIFGLTGRAALTSACIANLAGLVTGVGTQALTAIIATALARAFRRANDFASAGGLVTGLVGQTARGTGVATAIGATDSVLTSRDTSAFTCFPGASVVHAGL